MYCECRNRLDWLNGKSLISLPIKRSHQYATGVLSVQSSLPVKNSSLISLIFLHQRTRHQRSNISLISPKFPSLFPRWQVSSPLFPLWQWSLYNHVSIKGSVDKSRVSRQVICPHLRRRLMEMHDRTFSLNMLFPASDLAEIGWRSYGSSTWGRVDRNPKIEK